MSKVEEGVWLVLIINDKLIEQWSVFFTWILNLLSITTDHLYFVVVARGFK